MLIARLDRRISIVDEILIINYGKLSLQERLVLLFLLRILIELSWLVHFPWILLFSLDKSLSQSLYFIILLLFDIFRTLQMQSCGTFTSRSGLPPKLFTFWLLTFSPFWRARSHRLRFINLADFEGVIVIVNLLLKIRFLTIFLCLFFFKSFQGTLDFISSAFIL